MARKPGLGKGLGALIPETKATPEEKASTTSPSSPLRMVPVDAIRPNQFQPRKVFNDESLKTLAASVQELGVLQPIIVRPVEGEPDHFELIAGERRWRAAVIAKLELVPVLLQDDVNDRLSLEQAVVENLHRVDLHALEEAAAYQQLVDDFNLTHSESVRVELMLRIRYDFFSWVTLLRARWSLRKSRLDTRELCWLLVIQTLNPRCWPV